MELNKRRKKGIKGIDGKTYVPCLGSTKFQLTYNRQQRIVLALVTSDLSNEVVLSWRTLQRLGVPPEDYPRPRTTKPKSKFWGDPLRGLKITKARKGQGLQGLLVRSPRRPVFNHKNESKVMSWPAKERKIMVIDSKMKLETKAYTKTDGEKFKTLPEQRGRVRHRVNGSGSKRLPSLGPES